MENMEKMPKETPAIESVPDAAENDIDRAYQFAKEHNVGPISETDNKRILKKIDRHLLPLVRKITGGRGRGGYGRGLAVTDCWTDDHHLHLELYGQERVVLLSKFWTHR